MAEEQKEQKEQKPLSRTAFRKKWEAQEKDGKVKAVVRNGVVLKVAECRVPGFLDAGWALK